jgi:hypothetical protein
VRSRPRGVLAALPLLVVSLAVLFALRVMRPSLLPECFVKVCQLLVELAPSLADLLEACPALGICGAMALRFFCVSRAAFPPYFVDEALTHEV